MTIPVTLAQRKQCFVCTKSAQNKGKTLCSLLVFTQIFRQEIKNAIFSLSLLRFLDHMYLCVLEKMTALRACKSESEVDFEIVEACGEAGLFWW